MHIQSSTPVSRRLLLLLFALLTAIGTGWFLSACDENNPCTNCPQPGVDTLPPVVTLSSPPSFSTVGNTTAIQFSATDNFGVTKVELYVNDTLVSADSVPPLTATLDVTGRANAESVTYRLKVYDAVGLFDSTNNSPVYARWRQGFSDSDESMALDIKSVYLRSTATEIQMRVETNGNWGNRSLSAEGIFSAIFFDTDQNSLTGARFVAGGTIAINDIGAEFRAVIAPPGSGDSLGNWNSGTSSWGSLKAIETLRIQNNSNVFEFAVRRTDFGNPTSFDYVVSNVILPSDPDEWDWAPNPSSHRTYVVDGLYVGPPL